MTAKRKPIAYKNVIYNSMSALAKRFGLNVTTLTHRINDHQYTIADAVELPVGHFRHKKRAARDIKAKRVINFNDLPFTIANHASKVRWI